MTSRRTQREPTLTLQLTGSLQFKCLQDSPTKSEQSTPNTIISFNNLDAHPLYKLNFLLTEDQTFIEITTLHLYVKSNSSSLREVQSASREPIYTKYLHTGCITKWLRLYGCLHTLPQGIKPTVVHLNELHWAQAPMTESSVANQTGWVIWTSLISSWRTTTSNLSLSRSLTWDSFFFTHLYGFILVPMAANNLTFSSISSTYSASKLATWSSPSVTPSEVFTDTDPIGDDGVASTSTCCDTFLVFNLSKSIIKRDILTQHDPFVFGVP